MRTDPRILIIGAGPCGLGAAHRLLELGHRNFTVVDRHPYVGGLATSFHDDKGFTWDLAVHVAHSHYHYVDRLMDDLLPGGFFHHIRKSWVREYGAFIPYPFQNNIRHLPPGPRQECVDGLVELARRTERPPVRTFADWIQAMGGRGIAKHFMTPYNRKIWTVDPSEMNAHWVGDRVPTVDVNRVVQNIELQRDDVSWGPNSTFQFPKTGGTGAIWKALAARLPADRIRLGTALTALDATRRVATFSDGSRENYDAILSTMPLTLLADFVGDERIRRRAGHLRHTHVYVVGIAPEAPLPDHLADKTWVYVPEEEYVFYRVTPFSLFSPAHTPDPRRYCSFLCEVSRPADRPADWTDLVQQSIRDLGRSGLMQVDAARCHVFRMEAEYGYPIPTVDRDEILNDVMPDLERLGLYSRGRFGGWKYEVANMDHSLMQGVEVADRILRGTPEETWPTPNVVNAGKRPARST